VRAAGEIYFLRLSRTVHPSKLGWRLSLTPEVEPYVTLGLVTRVNNPLFPITTAVWA